MALSASVHIADIINASVMGNAIRFVSRKYFGNVWNRIQTTGAVSNWQLTVRAMLVQIFFMGSHLELCGYHPSMMGNIRNIPNVARYESWKPTEVITPGDTHNCIIRAVHRTAMGLLSRPG